MTFPEIRSSCCVRSGIGTSSSLWLGPCDMQSFECALWSFGSDRYFRDAKQFYEISWFSLYEYLLVFLWTVYVLCFDGALVPPFIIGWNIMSVLRCAIPAVQVKGLPLKTYLLQYYCRTISLADLSTSLTWSANVVRRCNLFCLIIIADNQRSFENLQGKIDTFINWARFTAKCFIFRSWYASFPKLS
jgi:hypothetical protein